MQPGSLGAEGGLQLPPSGLGQPWGGWLNFARSQAGMLSASATGPKGALPSMLISGPACLARVPPAGPPFPPRMWHSGHIQNGHLAFSAGSPSFLHRSFKKARARKRRRGGGRGRGRLLLRNPGPASRGRERALRWQPGGFRGTGQSCFLRAPLLASRPDCAA